MDAKELQARVKSLNTRVNKAIGGPDHTAMATFAITVLSIQVTAHAMHWSTPSRSDHLALEALYSGIADVIDTIVESYQGIVRERIPSTTYPTAASIPAAASPLEYVYSLQTYVDEARKLLPQNSELQNEIDGLKTLLNGVAYQLAELS